MTDALSSRALPRPPVSGPGSDTDTWRAFAAQETGRSIEGDLENIDSRAELIALVDHTGPYSAEKEAPEEVEVVEAREDDEGRQRPPRFDGPGGPQWAVPVKGGYVPEDELKTAERRVEQERLRKRHEDRLAQLRSED